MNKVNNRIYFNPKTCHKEELMELAWKYKGCDFDIRTCYMRYVGSAEGFQEFMRAVRTIDEPEKITEHKQ